LLDISLPSGEAREAVPCMLKDRTTWSVGRYHAEVLPTNVTSGGRGRDGSADQVLEIRLQTSENAAEATRDVDLAPADSLTNLDLGEALVEPQVDEPLFLVGLVRQGLTQGDAFNVQTLLVYIRLATIGSGLLILVGRTD